MLLYVRRWGGIPLNQKRLCADLVHEDEWELDDVSHFITQVTLARRFRRAHACRAFS
jgi:hypothetical protein